MKSKFAMHYCVKSAVLQYIKKVGKLIMSLANERASIWPLRNFSSDFLFNKKTIKIHIYYKYIKIKRLDLFAFAQPKE